MATRSASQPTGTSPSSSIDNILADTHLRPVASSCRTLRAANACPAYTLINSVVFLE
ncbi:MAG: hypothetical protein ACOYD1_04250 [Candidatus Nanopelagicales bacterium]